MASARLAQLEGGGEELGARAAAAAAVVAAAVWRCCGGSEGGGDWTQVAMSLLGVSMGDPGDGDGDGDVEGRGQGPHASGGGVPEPWLREIVRATSAGCRGSSGGDRPGAVPAAAVPLAETDGTAAASGGGGGGGGGGGRRRRRAGERRRRIMEQGRCRTTRSARVMLSVVEKEEAVMPAEVV